MRTSALTKHGPSQRRGRPAPGFRFEQADDESSSRRDGWDLKVVVQAPEGVKQS